MGDLNEDVLTRIFLNLHFIERVRIETVCRLWHYVLQSHACFSDMRSLNIAEFLGNTTSDYYQQESISLAPTIVGIVERCGPYVKSLSFGSRWLKVSQNVVDCIALNCMQLREIDLGAVILNADITQLIDNVADRLLVFSLEETSWVNNEHANKMTTAFAKFKRLESINLRSAMFSIENITQLPLSLRHIDISHAHRFSEEALVDFLTGHPYLQRIVACRCPVINQDIIDALSQLKFVQDLDLGFVHDRSYNLAPLAQLVTLRTLKFQNMSCLNETSLSAIMSNVPFLNSLSIIKCDRVFDYTSVAFCERLTSITISDTTQLSDDDIILLATRCSLRYIRFANSINVSTEGISFALEHCQLEQFHLVNCPAVTDEVMFVLAKSQDSIHAVSVERCTGITSKGVAALGWLRNIRQLKRLDVSKNRQIDDMAVLSLHNALTMASRSLFSSHKRAFLRRLNREFAILFNSPIE